MSCTEPCQLVVAFPLHMAFLHFDITAPGSAPMLLLSSNSSAHELSGQLIMLLCLMAVIAVPA